MDDQNNNVNNTNDQGMYGSLNQVPASPQPDSNQPVNAEEQSTPPTNPLDSVIPGEPAAEATATIDPMTGVSQPTDTINASPDMNSVNTEPAVQTEPSSTMPQGVDLNSIPSQPVSETPVDPINVTPQPETVTAAPAVDLVPNQQADQTVSEPVTAVSDMSSMTTESTPVDSQSADGMPEIDTMTSMPQTDPANVVEAPVADSLNSMPSDLPTDLSEPIPSVAQEEKTLGESVEEKSKKEEVVLSEPTEEKGSNAVIIILIVLILALLGGIGYFAYKIFLS